MYKNICVYLSGFYNFIALPANCDNYLETLFLNTSITMYMWYVGLCDKLYIPFNKAWYCLYLKITKVKRKEAINIVTSL